MTASPYRNVLLATDFSPTARLAADHAAAVASGAGAALHLLHVVEEIGYWEGFDLRKFPSPDVFAEMQKNARIALADLAAEIGAPDAAVEVREGKPFVEIARAARDVPADLVVVGSHGLTGLADTLFGSTAEKVVRKAPCPVLVVRSPEHASSMP